MKIHRMQKLITEQTSIKLQRKHLLLDTNFLLEAAKSPDIFFSIFQEFGDLRCQPITFPLIDFEFLRTAFQEDLRLEKQKLLQSLHCISLPIRPDIFNVALAFGHYYAAHRESPSLTDCFIAAMLKQHANDLILVTRNHKDFPAPLFVREGTFVIERPKDVLAFGLYRFDDSQKKILERFF